MSGRLQLSLACGEYDRTRPFFDGSVSIEGVDLTPLALAPEETFFRAFRHVEFDISELSFSSFLVQTARGECGYVGIPAFVSRSFRHGAFYVNDRSGIRTPQDLRGRRVGVPEYQVTAAVWARALLELEYGVAASEIEWIVGGVEEPGRPEKLKLNLPAGVQVEPAPERRTLGEMLETGDIDALICPRSPSCLGRSGVRRLFNDSRAAAADYYQRTGIFPIMHLVGLRKDLVERNPWLPQSVMKAFDEARKRAIDKLFDTTALSVMLPWLVEEAEFTRDKLGDVWSYGLDQNVETIETLLDQHHRQGLSARRVSVEEIFHPGSLERFSI